MYVKKEDFVKVVMEKKCIKGKRNPLVCLLNDETIPDGVTGLTEFSTVAFCILERFLKISVMQDN